MELPVVVDNGHGQSECGKQCGCVAAADFPEDGPSDFDQGSAAAPTRDEAPATAASNAAVWLICECSSATRLLAINATTTMQWE